ncbi:MAG TPA: class I SAM-dependent methyltransferase [Mycobacteriales bacterium]|nr:class I SAM-dependent methyltransferase [Mycobacteriales bacterium]
MSVTCVACGAGELEPMADLGQVPVLSGVTFDDERSALESPSARMTLACCPACCLAYNTSFDASLIEYDASYDNSLHHSATFQGYASELAGRLAREYDLRHKQVVELGCGKGHFLVELCRRAGARGIGYDPSYDGEVTAPEVTFVRDFISWDEPGEWDFFVARHVVEHLPDPWDYLSSLRAACGTRRVCGYIEVPDAIYDFERSPWNCHYPHVSYFSATALARLAIRAGFALLRLVRAFDGQYLALEVGLNGPTPDRIPFTGMGLRREREILESFRDQYPKVATDWRNRLESYGLERCAVWGAGAKGLAFLAAVDPGREIGAVVDLNPGKQGRFLPTGHQIRTPAELAGGDIAAVIITNPSYRAEIEQTLAAVDIRAEVIAAH